MGKPFCQIQEGRGMVMWRGKKPCGQVVWRGEVGNNECSELLGLISGRPRSFPRTTF